MTQDEVMREVRAIREAYAARFDYDARALYEDAKRREIETDREVVHLEPKPLDSSQKKSA